MKQFLLVAWLSCFSLSSFATNDTAVFAGGCFWCMEGPFDELDGIISTTSGYTGGHTENPTYKDTSTGATGHYEAVAVLYDSDKISYEALLAIFWKNIDPFDGRGQFCDKGPQYRAAIFTNNDKEKELAVKSKQALQNKLKGKTTIVTEILPAEKFYLAEDYHQDYYQKNPLRYKYYRYSCGRDKRLEQVQKMIDVK